jgi:hypothetical protein
MKNRANSFVANQEPDFEAACKWWTDLPNIWTPIGWKNHLFRFNVFWDGTILAQPDLNRRTTDWKGLGAQLSVSRQMQTGDDGLVRQGWNDMTAPVLWSEWPAAGCSLRQEVFAHVSGGKDIKTGIEPLFAWIRLSIHAICRGLPLEDQFGFAIRIAAPHIGTTMNSRDNIRLKRTEEAMYPRWLRPDVQEYSQKHGFRLLEPDGKVRLGVAPGQDCSISFGNINVMSVKLDTKPGRHVDVLLPITPMERKVFDAELALGYDRALAETGRYWSKRPKTAAKVQVPEDFINRAIQRNLHFGEVIAERNPADGNYSVLTGAFTYANLWPTPGAMALSLFMDNLGYHDVVERYLEIFHREQGTVVPPGDCFKLHPGYLSSPKTLTSIDWLTDHGALLWAISRHALLTGNQAFISCWLEPVIKAGAFIKYARRIEGHGGVAGIMPPAVATDKKTKIQAVWSDGWNYKGLHTAARFLKQIGHPRADEFMTEAAEYKDAFQKALRAKTKTMPAWMDDRGKRHHLIPTSMSGDQKEETRHAFYLDGGPLFLVFAGLMEADDPLMKSTLLWFRAGPQTKFYRHDSNCGQVPCLDHELSSCEPCYSWNVFHSWQTGDRLKFLEGMYSLWAGVLSRQTYTPCETRGGITALTPCLPQMHLARLAVIDDEIRAGELHLLRLVPLAWLKPGKTVRFEKMPTLFGPVSLTFEMAKDGRTLEVAFKPQFREQPKRIVLHIPPMPALKSIKFNGKKLAVTGKAEFRM